MELTDTELAQKLRKLQKIENQLNVFALNASEDEDLGESNNHRGQFLKDLRAKRIQN